MKLYTVFDILKGEEIKDIVGAKCSDVFLFPVESSVVQYTIPFPNFVGKSIQIHEKMHKLLSLAGLESFKASSGSLKLVSKELNHFGVIAGLFR